MQFLKIAEDGTRFLTRHPGWMKDVDPKDPTVGTRLLTSDELVAAGYGLTVVDPGEPTPGSNQRVVVAPLDEWTINKKSATKTYVLVDFTAEEIAARDQIEADELLRVVTKDDQFVKAFIGMTRDELRTYIEGHSGTAAQRVELIVKLAQIVLLIVKREYR